MANRASRPSDSSGRSHWLLAGLAVAGLSGCQASLQTAEAKSGSTGIVAEPVSALPPSASEATHGDGAVTLRTPIPPEAALALVRRLFDALHARNLEPVRNDFEQPVLDLTKSALVPSGPWGAMAPTDVFTWLVQRAKDNPFDQLDVELVYKPQEVELYAFGELGLPGRPARPAAMGEDDLFVRVPIVTPRVGTDTLFGDEIKLVLRRHGGLLRVHAYGEILPK
ncbi:MAG: hypothetical protein JNL79_18450 [Myxococcales bacterium]|nr:hypothetical protein [Myxococcales bacterium]